MVQAGEGEPFFVEGAKAKLHCVVVVVATVILCHSNNKGNIKKGNESKCTKVQFEARNEYIELEVAPTT